MREDHLPDPVLPQQPVAHQFADEGGVPGSAPRDLDGREVGNDRHRPTTPPARPDRAEAALPAQVARPFLVAVRVGPGTINVLALVRDSG